MSSPSPTPWQHLSLTYVTDSQHTMGLSVTCRRGVDQFVSWLSRSAISRLTLKSESCVDEAWLCWQHIYRRLEECVTQISSLMDPWTELLLCGKFDSADSLGIQTILSHSSLISISCEHLELQDNFRQLLVKAFEPPQKPLCCDIEV